jgi:hypothetical protein
VKIQNDEHAKGCHLDASHDVRCENLCTVIFGTDRGLVVYKPELLSDFKYLKLDEQALPGSSPWDATEAKRCTAIRRLKARRVAVLQQ